MRKIFSIIIIALAICNESFSQGFRIGVKGGPSLSNISNDPNNRIKFGIHAGGYFDMTFNEKMGAGAELLYSQKGTISKGNPDIKVIIDYIDIPLLFHYYFKPNLIGQAGLTIASPLRGIRVYQDGRPSEGFTQHIHKTVLSFPIGVRYDIDKLNFGARADIGLSAIGNDGKKNHVLMLSVGYSFFSKGTSEGSK